MFLLQHGYYLVISGGKTNKKGFLNEIMEKRESQTQNF